MKKKNNRRLGVLLEHEIIGIIANVFGLRAYKDPKWQIASTRAVSKVLDDEGVDIALRNCPIENYHFQIKRTTVNSATTAKIDIQPLLRIMGEYPNPVLITRLFKKHGKSNRNYGDYVTIPLHHYLTLLHAYTTSQES